MNKNNVAIGLLVIIVTFLAFIILKPKKQSVVVPQVQNEVSQSGQQVTTPNPNTNTLNESFINDGEKTPKIYSINPTQTNHQGTIITIKGAYLNGFEGGTSVWFENASGQRGVIEASSYVPVGSTTISFTLPNQLCTKNMGESGDPCPSYTQMKPGLYKVFVQPYSIPSNKLDFTIKQ